MMIETLSRDHAAPIDLDIESRELRRGLADALDERPDLQNRPDETPAAIITDQADRRANVPVLFLGSRDDAGDNRFAAVLDPSLDPHLILSVARVVAGGYMISTPVRLGGEVRERAVLSPRERQVLDLLVDGSSNKVVARRLDISVHTAKFHVAAVIEKLGATNRSDAVAIAFRDGYLAL